MKTARNLSIATLLAGALLTVSTATTARADGLHDLFKTAAKELHRHHGGGGGQWRPDPGFGPGPGYRPDCRPDPICRPRPICPPHHCYVYVVYYRHCHGRWRCYDEFRSHGEARRASWRLERSGYETRIDRQSSRDGGPLGGGWNR